MDFAAISPQAIGTGLAVLTGCIAAIRVVGRNGNQAPQVPVNPAPTAGNGPTQVTPPPGAPAIMPMPAPVPPALAVVPPPPPPAPPAPMANPPALALPVPAIVVVTWMMALANCGHIFLALNVAALDVAPLVVPMPNAVRYRIRGMRNRQLRTMSDLQMSTYIRRIWDGARSVGGSRRVDPNFNNGEAEAMIRTRLRKIFLNVAPDDTRFADRGVHDSSVLSYPVSTREYVIPRINAASAKQNDKYLEVFGIRSDTQWVVDHYVLWWTLAYRYGCNVEQAKYLAASKTLDCIFVYYGLDPQVGVVGITPEDIGFTVPNGFPATYQRRA